MVVPLQAATAVDNAARIVAQGFSVVASSPDELLKNTKDQLERYGKLFRQVGIQAD